MKNVRVDIRVLRLMLIAPSPFVAVFGSPDTSVLLLLFAIILGQEVEGMK